MEEQILFFLSASTKTQIIVFTHINVPQPILVPSQDFLHFHQVGNGLGLLAKQVFSHDSTQNFDIGVVPKVKNGSAIVPLSNPVFSCSGRH